MLERTVLVRHKLTPTSRVHERSSLVLLLSLKVHTDHLSTAMAIDTVDVWATEISTKRLQEEISRRPLSICLGHLRLPTVNSVRQPLRSDMRRIQVNGDGGDSKVVVLSLIRQFACPGSGRKINLLWLTILTNTRHGHSRCLFIQRP